MDIQCFSPISFLGGEVGNAIFWLKILIIPKEETNRFLPPKLWEIGFFE